MGLIDTFSYWIIKATLNVNENLINLNFQNELYDWLIKKNINNNDNNNVCRLNKQV